MAPCWSLLRFIGIHLGTAPLVPCGTTKASLQGESFRSHPAQVLWAPVSEEHGVPITGTYLPPRGQPKAAAIVCNVSGVSWTVLFIQPLLGTTVSQKNS